MAGHRGRACTGRFAYLGLRASLLGAVMCGCQSTQSGRSPPRRRPRRRRRPIGRAGSEAFEPLPVRPVQQVTANNPGQVPRYESECPVAPANVLTTCDLGRTTLYTLGPESDTAWADTRGPAQAADGGLLPSESDTWIRRRRPRGRHSPPSICTPTLPSSATISSWKRRSSKNGQFWTDRADHPNSPGRRSVGPIGRPPRMTYRPLAIGFLSVFGLPPVEFVDLAADLGCRYISTVCRECRWCRSAIRRSH